MFFSFLATLIEELVKTLALHQHALELLMGSVCLGSALALQQRGFLVLAGHPSLSLLCSAESSTSSELGPCVLFCFTLLLAG